MPMPKTSPLAPSPLADNPFALLMDPQGVQAIMLRSVALNQLRRRQHRPLECTVMRCASREQAAFDRKIDPATVYLAPDDWQPPVRPVG